MGLRTFLVSLLCTCEKSFCFANCVKGALCYSRPRSKISKTKAKQNKNLGLNAGSVPWGHASQANMGVDFEGSN